MALDTFTENGFTVKIHQDQDASNPHEDDAPGCQLVMSHRRYNWPNDAGISFDDFDGWQEIADELAASHDALTVETVYAYDHSGIAFKVGARVGQFADPWDSGIAGLAYVTRQNWQETQGTAWTGSESDLEQAHKLMAAEVEVYGQWANGETYGYTITDEYGEEVDSCWGFIGWESVEQEARESAKHLQHQVKCSGTLNRETGTVDHAGPCPLHGET